MSQHVPDDLLASFVEGDVGEQLAVHIAEHLDECPACSTRAAVLEPLAAAFASVDDPMPPPDLVQAVLTELTEPERLPVAEIGVGIGLLVAATALTASVESPVSLVVELGVLLHAVASMTKALAAGLGASSVALTAATVLALIGGAWTLRLATPVTLDLDRRLP